MRKVVLVALLFAVIGTGAVLVFAATSSAWTDEELESFRVMMLRGLEDKMPPALANRYVECTLDKMVEEWPAGPSKMSDQDRASVKDKTALYARGCGETLARLIGGAQSWDSDPDFATWYTWSCSKTHGPKMSRWCECLAGNARKQFASPSAFVALDQMKQEAMPPAERARLTLLAQECADALKEAVPPESTRRTDPKSWSRHGWMGLQWKMGPGDVVVVLKDAPGQFSRATDEDREAFGLAADLLYYVTLTESVYGHPSVAVLKFDSLSRLFGALVITPNVSFGGSIPRL